MFRNLKVISSVLLCFYLAAVGLLCFMKPDELPEVPKLWFGIPADKVAHFIMFLPFPTLSFMTFRPKDAGLAMQLLLLALLLVIGAGLAIGTEHLQAMTGYRSYDLKDFGCDMSGMVCGALATAAYIITRQPAGK